MTEGRALAADAESRKTTAPNCPVCGEPLRPGQRAWVLRCSRCGFLASTLSPSIGDPTSSILREDARAEALRPLRDRNFSAILDRLAEHGARPGARLLEVGCAHGWFMDAAKARGYVVEGIEPDAAIAADPIARGHGVTHGFFPQDLASTDAFDVIVFNDVFEHLPDPAAALDACRERLAPDGLLVLNLPSSHGVFFRVAATLDRLGFAGPYRRMWQHGFPSPHLSYFSPSTLDRLAGAQGFDRVYQGALASIDTRGLWSRLRYGGTVSALKAAGTWAVVVLATPLLRVAPADIALHIYKPASPRIPSRS
jgi:SAM-dependent methyltransferase